MAISGGRRGRGSRTLGMRLGNGPGREMLTALRDRRVQLRLLLCGAALAVLTISVHGWKLAFPFRLDQQPLHGVAAKIKFEKVNKDLTKRAPDRASEDVPLIFRHDPQPLAR